MTDELTSNSSDGGEAPEAAEMAEVTSIGQEFDQLEEDFGLGLTSAQAGNEMSELDQATADTPFAVTTQTETMDGPTLLDIADGNFGNDQEFFGGVARRSPTGSAGRSPAGPARSSAGSSRSSASTPSTPPACPRS